MEYKKTKLIAKQTIPFLTKSEEMQVQELSRANEAVAFQNAEKIKYAAELKIANKSLIEIKKIQTKYIKGLEEMMFLISHAVRKPVANIIGIAVQLKDSRLPKTSKKLIECMKISAVSLEVFTKKLTIKINALKKI